jgi:hypothetical protein
VSSALFGVDPGPERCEPETPLGRLSAVEDHRSPLEELLAPEGAASLAGALLEALEQAEAIPMFHWASSPAKPAPLDPSTIAEALRLHRDIDRGHPLVRIALEESRRGADGSLVDLLSRHARNGFSDLPLSPGTLGGALKARALDGLRVEAGARSLRIDWLAPQVEKSNEGSIDVALTLDHEGALFRSRGHCPSLPGTALERRLDPDYLDRVSTALLGALESSLCEPSATHGTDEILDRILDAMTPPIPEGLARWVIQRGMEVLRADGSPAARAESSGRVFTLRFDDVSLEERFRNHGVLKLEVALVAERDGTLEDATLSEAQALPFTGDDLDHPAPSDEAPLRAALAAWRSAMGDHLARIMAIKSQEDGLPPPTFLFDAGLPFSLAAAWTREGPPGPPPARSPSIRIDPERASRAEMRLRRIEGDELERIREEVDRQAAGAFALDGWTVLFCPFHRPAGGTFEEDRIVVIPEGASPLAILMSDPWNGHVMPIDGDAEVFRAFAAFWREVIAARGLDVTFEQEADDEDAEDDEPPSEPRTRSLLEWLTFPLPGGDEPRFPRVDWRIQGAGDDDDFIASFNFWESGPFGMSPERREVFQRGIETHYHALLRDVVDPEFPRRRDEP